MRHQAFANWQKASYGPCVPRRILAACQIPDHVSGLGGLLPMAASGFSVCSTAHKGHIKNLFPDTCIFVQIHHGAYPTHYGEIGREVNGFMSGNRLNNSMFRPKGAHHSANSHSSVLHALRRREQTVSALRLSIVHSVGRSLFPARSHKLAPDTCDAQTS